MLFNSYVFIFAFLPVTVIVYFLLNRFRLSELAKMWLALSSLFFYGWWDVKYVPLILASIGFNYLMGRLLMRPAPRYRGDPDDPNDYLKERGRGKRRALLAFAVICNVLLLIYYKYADFFLTNLNEVAGTNFGLLKLILPLGISFFTFTQIAFLVDAYKRKAREANIVSYVLFVTFYPHLIAGPILHHSEMMPQFDRVRNKAWNWRNASLGIFVFGMGLFKKVVIADTFANYASDGFASATQFLATWVAALSYTFQLYFDFSGYTDMAIGAALLFNIRLPQNFNSPYKALNLQDFWRRWHMTLSRWLRDYIYIPLGGNRKGEARMLTNLMIVFLVGGLWHGAGWTFLFWGFLHGFGQVIHRLWGKFCKLIGFKLPQAIAWLITFVYVVIAWVFFRATSIDQAMRILKGMFGLSGFDFDEDSFIALLPAIAMLVIFFPIVLFAKNSSERMETFRPTWLIGLIIAFLFIVSLLYFNQISEFLYFNF
ncbi:D-alanyl-lipoteichoic acid acyltransferase DltB (MBOAT superfamily) [Paenibacillus phyllosphaerae]|uniref:D-alanyl-lipoteichoic acid acyltransferase DltB (MBOAT superfamily) n=1 Tax=Paenibacillus phyllosphaerae TaxID=274593 RepID=A0A7W5B1L2_9BACL|nr:MBOAT family protein [Paenibacillus phyllosphaerae]MBB3112688.1 D-alanyl-lipoteichoic acid acyltransferase DltB (MBOAT superfamily) [Paenibacillus phyllosphaerae]